VATKIGPDGWVRDPFAVLLPLSYGKFTGNGWENEGNRRAKERQNVCQTDANAMANGLAVHLPFFSLCFGFKFDTFYGKAKAKGGLLVEGGQRRCQMVFPRL